MCTVSGSEVFITGRTSLLYREIRTAHQPRPEDPVVLGVLDDPGDAVVGLHDLVEVGAAEGVGGACDLDDDHLHQIRVVAVGVDDERGDRVQLLARRLRRGIGLGDRREHHVPALEEQRVEDRLLGREVVVDEPVGDAGLIGDVRDTAGVDSPIPPCPY